MSDHLIPRLREGDADAYEELVRAEMGRMLSVARRYLRSEDDARDAVQEAFIAAFESIERFKGDSKLSTWLHRIVVNKALMKLRTKRRKPEESLEHLLPTYKEDGHQTSESEPWGKPTAHELLEEGEIRDAVRAAIEKLPESFRTVVLLRDLEGLSGAEAADMLGITPNAVKIRLHRARQALRSLLDPKVRELIR